MQIENLSGLSFGFGYRFEDIQINFAFGMGRIRW